jgi:heme A synthase
MGFTSAIELLVPEEESERARSILADFTAEVDARQNRPKEAITAEIPPEPAEESGTAPTADEQLIVYAFRASLLGFLVCTPVLPIAHIYALLLVLAVTFRNTPTRPEYSRRYYFALIVSAVVVSIGAVFMLSEISVAWFAFYVILTVVPAVIMFRRTIRASRENAVQQNEQGTNS